MANGFEKSAAGAAPGHLPHRFPFIFVDRVLEVEPGRRLVAVKSVTRNEPQFSGHFPDRPIMPGVLLCEALAQAGGLLIHATVFGGIDAAPPPGEELGLMLAGLESARFRRPVVPGDQVILEVELVRHHRPLWKLHGVARVEGQVAAQADLSIVEVGEGSGDARPSPDHSGAVASRAVATGEPARKGVTLHPTAVVEAGAELDEGVEVGPGAVIGSHVRIGRGSRIGAGAQISGHTTLGVGNQIFPHAIVGATPQDLKYHGEPGRLLLGDHNQIREFATLSIGTESGGMETVLGDQNLIMNYAHVGHDCRLGNGVVLANGVQLAGHVTVQDHAIVSGLAAVAQFVTIGNTAFVGGGSMVVMDVPPFCMANGDRARLVGLNTVGLERRGVGPDETRALKRAFQILFKAKERVTEAVARIRTELADSPASLELAAFVESSAKGVTRP